MSDLADLSEADLEQPSSPVETGPLPWPTEFELDVRRRLSSIESHQLRTDAVLMQVQLEVRRGFRRIEGRMDLFAQKMSELVSLLRSVSKEMKNGHGDG